MIPKVEVNKKILKTLSETPDIWLRGPFTTTNGCMIAVYLDMRMALSDINNLKIISREIHKFIKKKKIKVDFIIGGATARITPAVALAFEMNKPVGFVRKEPKKGGTGKAVEGNFKKGMNAILIDDAHGQGAGKVPFINYIRKEGLKIDWVIVVASRSHHHEQYFRWMPKAKVKLQSFCDIKDMVDYSLKHNIISKEAAQLMMWFWEDAQNWNKDKEKMEFFKNYFKKKKYPTKSGI